MNAQIIVTPTGERLAVLPEADYLALLDAAEEVSDRAAVAAFRRDLAAGEEEMLPAALVDRILAGDSPVRVWREYRGLTGEALAAAAGIAQSYVSQIETGRRDGTLDTMVRLARALDVTVDDLVPVAPGSDAAV